MNRFSEKVYLELIPPTEEDPRSDHQRLIQALEDAGFHPVKISLPMLRLLH